MGRWQLWTIWVFAWAAVVFSALVDAAPSNDRELTGKTIRNGAAVLTLPTSTSTLLSTTSTVGISSGGTGATTAPAAFAALAPSPTPSGNVLGANGSAWVSTALVPGSVGLGNVTNEAQIPKTIGTAKGQIIGFTASASPSPLPSSSTDGYVLTADSAQLLGIKWAPGGTGTSSKNFVPNPSAASNISGLTGVNVTIGRDTSPGYKYNGVASFALSGATHTASVTTDAMTLDDDVIGMNCEARVAAKGDASKWKFALLDGLSNILASVQMQNSTANFREYSANYPCANGYKLQVVSTASSPDMINVAGYYWGRATNIGTTAQAQFVGGINIFGASGFSVAGTGAVDYTATAGTTYGASGSLSAPSTLIPAFTYTNMPSGEYLAYVAGPFKTVSGTCVWELIDDSANRWVGELHQTAAGYAGGLLSARFAYTSTANRTIRIRLSYQSVASNCTLDLGFNKMSISLYRFPSQSELAVKPDQAAASQHSHVSIAGYGSTNTTVLRYSTHSVDLGSDITYAASASAGDSWTINTDGVYSITGTLRENAGGNQIAIGRNLSGTQLTTDPTTVAITSTGDNGWVHQAMTTAGMPNPFGWTGKLVKGDVIRISIKAGLTFSTANLTITKVSSNMSAPLLVGGVVSPYSGVAAPTWAYIAGASNTSNCTGATCSTYGTGSGTWITTVTRNSTGNYTFTIPSGIFGVAPMCTCGAEISGTTNTGTCTQNYSGATPTSFTISTGNAGAAADARFLVHCWAGK